MRLAIPSWNGRVSPVFDTAQQLLVVDIVSGEERSRQIVPLAADPFLTKRVKELCARRVDVLICGGISHSLADLVTVGKVKVISWVAGPVEEVLQAYLVDHLSDLKWRMPGCRGRRHTREKRPSATPSS
jgi:predicted Fe-Mo cluster-binding NifX family protein